MKLLQSITLVILIILSAASCKKPSVCNEGLVTYEEVKIEYASIVTFNTRSTINLGGMTKDVKLTPADATDGVIYTTGDLNLNGYKLTLNNVKLIVVGNLNGGGTVVTRGAKGGLCVRGNTQNNPDLSDAVVGCSTLSNDKVESYTKLGTECDLGRVEYVGSKRFKAVDFELL